MNVVWQGQSLEELERQVIAAALERHPGNQAGAARELGISHKTLHNKIHKYDLLVSTPAARQTAQESIAERIGKHVTIHLAAGEAEQARQSLEAGIDELTLLGKQWLTRMMARRPAKPQTNMAKHE